MTLVLDWSLKTDAAEAALAGLARLADDMTEAMDEIGGQLLDSAAERILTTNVGPDGTPWPQSRRAREQGGSTLHETGQLLRGLETRPRRDGVDVVNDEIYAAIHQFGGTIRPKTAKALAIPLPGGGVAYVGKVDMPARPYLGVSAQDETAIDAIIGRHLRAAAGLGGAP